MENIGKFIIIIGLFIILAGVILIISDRIGLHLFRLPGDIVYRKGNTTVYFPIATGIILSLLISFILWLFRR